LLFTGALSAQSAQPHVWNIVLVHGADDEWLSTRPIDLSFAHSDNSCTEHGRSIALAGRCA
jgi:hypothetical protein